MPQGSTRVSKPLTNLSVLYKNDNYIAGQVLGNLPVVKESDLYWVYNSEQRLPQTLRANKSQANMYTWDASTSSYTVEEHSLKDVISDRDYENVDSALQLERHTMETLIDKIMMRLEYETQKLLFTTTTFSSNATLTTATSWNYNTTTSAPIQNVLSATVAITKASMKKPNFMVTNLDVLASLKENTNIYSRIQYTDRAILTEEILASLFDLDKVFVGTAMYDQGKEGGTESMTTIFPSDALIGYFKPNPKLRDVSAAVNMRVMKYGSPYKVKKWREEDIEGNMIEVQSMFKPKAVATSCAYLFKTAALI